MSSEFIWPYVLDEEKDEVENPEEFPRKALGPDSESLYEFFDSMDLGIDSLEEDSESDLEECLDRAVEICSEDKVDPYRMIFAYSNSVLNNLEEALETCEGNFNDLSEGEYENSFSVPSNLRSWTRDTIADVEEKLKSVESVVEYMEDNFYTLDESEVSDQNGDKGEIEDFHTSLDKRKDSEILKKRRNEMDSRLEEINEDYSELIY